MATLTYVYNDSTAVIGPLATSVEPHGYDLCRRHSTNLSAPRGWEVIRLSDEFGDPEPSDDDLLALADAVREVGLNFGTETVPQPRQNDTSLVEVARRGHLTVLADPDA